VFAIFPVMLRAGGEEPALPWPQQRASLEKLPQTVKNTEE